MSECTCGESHEAPTEEIVEAEKSEALDEPVEETSLDKHEELYKDMEQTLAKLKEVMAYLEEMAGEEKAEEEEEEAEPEEEEAEEEEKAEEEMEEEEEEEEEEEMTEEAAGYYASDFGKFVKVSNLTGGQKDYFKTYWTSVWPEEFIDALLIDQ